jgi:hypothetical protein
MKVQGQVTAELIEGLTGLGERLLMPGSVAGD